MKYNISEWNTTSDRSKLAVEHLYCNNTKAFENIFVEATSVCKPEDINFMELGKIWEKIWDLWEIWKLWCQWIPITSNHLPIISYPLCQRRNQDFKQDIPVGSIFSKILVGEQKGGNSMCCGSSMGELVEFGQSFLNELQK